MEEIKIKLGVPYKLVLEYEGVTFQRIITINDQSLEFKRTETGVEMSDIKIEQMDYQKARKIFKDLV